MASDNATAKIGGAWDASVAGPPARFAGTVARIEAALRAELDGWLDSVPARLGEAIRYALLGPGKRIRPALVLWSAELCESCEPGGPPPRLSESGDYSVRRAGAADGLAREGAPARVAGAMPAAVAIEMLHTYSLVHDDLPAMDDDALRRGRPTCHVVYGDGLAILVGDALLTRAFEVLGSSSLPAERVAREVAVLARAAGAAGMIGGQAEDLAHEGVGGDLAAVQYVHEQKTAALLSASCRLGAIAAGADAGAEESLAEFGRALGLAFQITDDLLDELGRTEQLGKQAGKDRAAGKLTYPSVAGVEASRQEAGRWLAQAQAALDRLAAGGAAASGQAARADLLADFRSLGRYIIERNR